MSQTDGLTFSQQTWQTTKEVTKGIVKAANTTVTPNTDGKFVAGAVIRDSFLSLSFGLEGLKDIQNYRDVRAGRETNTPAIFSLGRLVTNIFGGVVSFAHLTSAAVAKAPEQYKFLSKLKPLTKLAKFVPPQIAIGIYLLAVPGFYCLESLALGQGKPFEILSTILNKGILSRPLQRDDNNNFGISVLYSIWQWGFDKDYEWLGIKHAPRSIDDNNKIEKNMRTFRDKFSKQAQRKNPGSQLPKPIAESKAGEVPAGALAGAGTNSGLPKPGEIQP